MVRGPDADQTNFEIRGPDRTRTKKFSRPADRTGRGPRKFLKWRTDEDRLVRGPGGPWIPGPYSHFELTLTHANYKMIDYYNTE